MSRRVTATAVAALALTLSLVVSAAPAQATEDARPTRLKNDKELFLESPGDKDHKYKYRTKDELLVRRGDLSTELDQPRPAALRRQGR